jgi:quinol monooxygenase YgiN
MSASVVTAFICAVFAAAGTGVLVARCIRTPRMYLVGWAGGLFGLAIALGSEALGAHSGYQPASFRAIQIGAQLVAPLWLAWGVSELAARSGTARFMSRLVTGALTLVAGVVLSTDPLSDSTFTTAWPTASAHYQFIPKYAIELVAAVSALIVVTALISAAVRARGNVAWRRPLVAAAAAGAAALVVIGFRLNLPASYGYAAVGAVCTALAWFAGTWAEKVQLTSLRGAAVGGAGGAAADWDAEDDEEAPGPFGDLEPALGFGRGDQRYGDTNGNRDAAEDNWYRPVAAQQPNGARPARVGYPQDGGLGMNGRGQGDRESDRLPPRLGSDIAEPPLGEPVRAESVRAESVRAESALAASDRLPARSEPPAVVVEEDPQQRLYGLIAIYTLDDNRVADFDVLAEQVVREVRTAEPDALVYVVHSVPNAPLQRIFYEVYRDRMAYEEHQRRPYIAQFEADTQPYVLATNVIELGTRQAKLSTLPGLSSIFDHSAGG